MAPKPLEVLRKGLARFQETIKTRKNELTAKLARAETISSSDEHWLDDEANTVDEERVLDTLESAPTTSEAWTLGRRWKGNCEEAEGVGW